MITCGRQAELEKRVGNLQRLLELTQATIRLTPDGLDITVIVLENAKQVQDVYFARYQKRVKYKHFMSLSEMTVWVSLRDVNADVMIHEFAHCIVEQHYGRGKTPWTIHELIAQGAVANYRKLK